MQYHFVGKNIEVTNALKEFTTKKFQSIEKHYDKISDIHVVFHVEHSAQTAEATLHLNGAEIHAAAKANDMYEAIDGLVNKLLSQIVKRKEKIIEQQHS